MPEDLRLVDDPLDVSLLWPPSDRPWSTTPLSKQCSRDLDLTAVLMALQIDRDQRRTVESILMDLCLEPKVIEYRQDVVADLLAHPSLVSCFADLQRLLNSLAQFRFLQGRGHAPLHEVIWRLSELETFVMAVERLKSGFDELGKVSSEGLLHLRDIVEALLGSPLFQRLKADLPDLIADVRTSASVTIGVNLDAQLRPTAAVLLSINRQSFSQSTFLQRVLGQADPEANGIAPLHHAATGNFTDPTISQMMAPLFRDVADVLEKAAQATMKALRRYVKINTDFLLGLLPDLSFYLGAVSLIRHLEGLGLAVCRPQIAPMVERIYQVEANYNLNLALRLAEQHPSEAIHEMLVPNDVEMGEQGRIMILTGPNQGGKTTYMQAVGVTQILAQSGLWVPGESTRISPVDGIYSHYPIEEADIKAEAGRFGDEALRLSQIFQQATRHSLILMNESLAGTSPGEGLYVAQDVVRVMRRLGVRAIFATHFHELAAQVDQLNAETDGDSRVISMVASLINENGDGPRRSYRVIESPPMGRSYAREIARRYGISFEQLVETLDERGALD
ncbi:MAG: hypothetical protein GYB68_17250 [Chloroflexi bacterium]|nr:hypothetical protein [Chloroflexota bacterium]